MSGWPHEARVPQVLNRASIFSAIRTLVPGDDGGERAAVIAVRVDGLRERALRLGYAAGDSAADRAHEVMISALRPRSLSAPSRG